MSVEKRSTAALIQEMLDGALSEDEREDLLQRVAADDAVRTLYLNQVAAHSALQAVLADCLPPNTEVVSAAPTEPQSTSSFHSSRKVLAIMTSLAATVFLLIGSLAFWGSRAPKTVPSTTAPPLAIVAQAVGAYTSDGVAIRSGQKISSGLLSMQRGVLRLDLASGATLAVEGPAQVDLVDATRIALLAGVITANIPESAIGFVVDTNTAHVVDLGTAFGVSISDDGSTNVCVFEGEVEVSSAEHARLGEVPQLLKQGEAVRASGGSSVIDSIDYDTSVFENAWPVNSGVLQTTGSMRFVSPGPNFHPGNYEDNEHIIVFPERRGFIPSDTIRVDMVDPGQYAKARHEDKPILLTQQRLTSYLLQLNAHPEGDQPNRRRSVRGQITFAKPIVGVIMANRLLKESEIVFGIPGVEYPGPRMIEARPEGDQRPGFDTVLLAADRRTLIIELQENPGDLDQFRVLVEAE